MAFPDTVIFPNSLILKPEPGLGGGEGGRGLPAQIPWTFCWEGPATPVPQHGWFWLFRDNWVEPSLQRDIGSLGVPRKEGQPARAHKLEYKHFFQDI